MVFTSELRECCCNAVVNMWFDRTLGVSVCTFLVPRYRQVTMYNKDLQEQTQPCLVLAEKGPNRHLFDYHLLEKWRRENGT